MNFEVKMHISVNITCTLNQPDESIIPYNGYEHKSNIENQ